MRFVLLLPLLVACSDKTEKTDVVRGGLGGAELSPVSDQIRIDVYPSDGGSNLLPQSWVADVGDGLEGIEILLEPTITVKGEVVGYRVNPLNADVPGEGLAPVAATVRVARTGTITGGSVETGEDGSFSLRVPASRGYTLSIVPEDGTRLPFFVSMDNNLNSSVDLETIDLGYGVPVYGHLKTRDGLGLQSLKVRLRDPVSGVSGPSSQTDSTGHYLLRGLPGTYVLGVEGQPGSALPSFEVAAEVFDEDSLELDVNIGKLEPSLITGQLFSQEDASALRDIKVRLESTSLSGSIGQLDIETETDGDGLFGRQILAGEWRASFIPPYDSTLGGFSLDFLVDSDEVLVDIGDVVLPQRIVFEGRVTDPSGAPVAEAAVNAQEVGLDGYIFSATTDTDGGFALEVPPAIMRLTVSAANPELAVTKWEIDPTVANQVFPLSEGEQMSGTVKGPGGVVGFALIEVRTMNGDLLATTLSDVDGQFSVSLTPL